MLSKHFTSNCFLVFSFLGLLFATTASGQQTEEERIQLFRRLVEVVCSPSLAPHKRNIVNDCDSRVPQSYRDVFLACAKDTLGVSELTLPLLCYRNGPDSNKLEKCLEDREAEAAKAGVVIMEQIKQKYRTDYTICLQKAL